MTVPEQLHAAAVSIKASPMAPVPGADPLTADQWGTIMAIADTVIPSIVQKSKGNQDDVLELYAQQYHEATSSIQRDASHHQDNGLVSRYLADRPSQNPEFKAAIHRLLALGMPQDVRKQMILILNLLNYRASSLLLTGSTTAFADLPFNAREAILLSWSNSYVPLYRNLYKQLTALVKQNWVKTTPVLYRILGLPRIPVHGKTSPGFQFEFIQIPPGRNEEILETDVVIVGSGCGAGVMAKNLSEAGHRVLVVDKGYHWPPEHLPMNESEGWSHLYMNGGAMFSDDASIAVVAGSCWGGGGTVNWSACLQTQGFVRNEWATKDNLPFFASAEYQDCLDTVCNRMGVSAHPITHNKSNDVLLEGARRLGWSARPVPQNTGGAQHYCGYCSFGCGSCEKQGPVVSWLPDAARNGAMFIEGFDVNRVTFAKQNGKKIATGIEGTWTSRDEHGGVAGPPLTKRKVTVRAKRIVISAGTMSSPLILKRSGLQSPWIGDNLRLHPVTFVGAVYDEEVRPWEGGILTAVVSEFENQDHRGHGCKIESVVMMPSGWLTFLPWTGGLEYKLRATQLKNMVGHLVLARDTGAGSVYPDPHDGRPRMVFTPSKADRKHLIEGMLGAARINYIMGAREIFTTIPGTPVWRRPSSSPTPTTADPDPTFTSWLATVRARGLPDPDTVFLSAHQMGTCKMSATPQGGVVDARGKVWEVDEGLYVADASVFPSASGVNPMVTNMGVCEWIARGLVREWGARESARM